jgi:hypothetical protein
MLTPQISPANTPPTFFGGTRMGTQDDFELIPGLPYTREERIAAIQRAEEDYTAGRFTTSDTLRARHPRI